MSEEFIPDPVKSYKPKQPIVANSEQQQSPQPSVAPLKTALRKRTASEMREAASTRLDLAIEAVEAILRDPEARHSDKLAAATFIRDTSHGKPTERIEHGFDLMTLILGANKKEQALLVDSTPLIEGNKEITN